ncbi:MAG: hypothetical protein EOM51_02725 [Clostridia bacterium]|nr:hypothetical protein [Clostridia bacterium]
MKKIWKIILLVSLVLFVAGVICVAVSYFMGGSLEGLMQNEKALPTLETLSPKNLLNILMTLFGF